jgi:hypothetical protein
LHSYEHARSKTEKSIIVSDIIDKLGSASRLIRYDRKTGMYFDIGEEATREKVGQTLREAGAHSFRTTLRGGKERTTNALLPRPNEKKVGGTDTSEMASTTQLDIPEKRRSLRIMKGESLCGVDKALSAMAPTLEFTSSNTWFENKSDSEESDTVLYGEDLDALFATPQMITSCGLVERVSADSYSFVKLFHWLLCSGSNLLDGIIHTLN